MYAANPAAYTAAQDVFVASVSHPARTLFAIDVVTDPADSRNSYVADPFGVRTVRPRAPIR